MYYVGLVNEMIVLITCIYTCNMTIKLLLQYCFIVCLSIMVMIDQSLVFPAFWQTKPPGILFPRKPNKTKCLHTTFTVYIIQMKDAQSHTQLVYPAVLLTVVVNYHAVIT